MPKTNSTCADTERQTGVVDINSLTTSSVAVSGGGIHTISLVIAAGRPFLEALYEAGYHADATLSTLKPIAQNASRDDPDVYPAITNISICAALIESLIQAIEHANADSRVAGGAHG